MSKAKATAKATRPRKGVRKLTTTEREWNIHLASIHLRAAIVLLDEQTKVLRGVWWAEGGKK